MDIDEPTLRSFLHNPKAIFGIFILISTTASVTWHLAKNASEGEINTLKEQVNLGREQLSWCLVKSKESSDQCPPPPTKPPLTTDAQPPTNPPTKGENTVPKKPLPSSVKTYPRISDPSRPTKDEVQAMADYYGLFRKWAVNPNLKFQTGDISHFSGQQLSEKELQLEFDSRRIVLERAEQTGLRIPSQGDLAALAQEIKAQLVK